MGRLKGTILSDSTRKKMKDSNTTRIRVKCNETGECFDSIKTASIKMEIDMGNLSSHLKGFRKTVSGYTFSILK